MALFLSEPVIGQAQLLTDNLLNSHNFNVQPDGFCLGVAASCGRNKGNGIAKWQDLQYLLP